MTKEIEIFGAGPKGKALYFESQETAREYLSKKSKGKDKNIK